MILNDALYIFFRRIQPEYIIKSWLNSFNDASYSSISMLSNKNSKMKTEFINSMQNEFGHYSVDEALYAYDYIREYIITGIGANKNYGIFGLFIKATKDLLITDRNNECLCKSKELLQFRELVHPIGAPIFVSAYLAANDIENNFDRRCFSWNPVIRSLNRELYNVLKKGMAENHFHIGGSSDAFMFSWICLMNHFTPERKKEFKKNGIDSEPLDAFYPTAYFPRESNYLLSFKAACIRLFLFLRLGYNYSDESNEEHLSDKINEEWLKKMLSLDEESCHLHTPMLNSYFTSLRCFCTSVDSTGFIPDYALINEPIYPKDDEDSNNYIDLAVRNYERRLFRPLAGEHRFLYLLFKSVFSNDKRIEYYHDIIYAYLLICCRIRGELVQVNKRIGFENFHKYQDRKTSFTENYPQYDNMRIGIAERMVLENPFVVSLEGRITPAKTEEEYIDKIKYYVDRGTKSICGVSDFIDDKTTSNNADIQNETYSNLSAKYIKEDELKSKIHFVIHIPKNPQPIKNNELFELINSRNSILRRKSILQANALIEARRINPQIMRFVTGIDACSNEIDCRPEVFSCAMRKLRSYDVLRENGINSLLPNLRITYHAGEDFLDPVSGLRAMNEAMNLCKMEEGDRFGHGLALGIDCEEWYSQKKHTLLMTRQEIIDNLSWLYGMMKKFNIIDYSLEGELREKFNQLFYNVYLTYQENENFLLNSVDIDCYFESLKLRGDDPELFIHNPESQRELFESAILDAAPWKTTSSNPNKIILTSALLYHYYHFGFQMKKASSVIEEYKVSKRIVDAVCLLQEKMQYDIADKKISLECNPSSNYLIGTFKDYLKHPIFRFNNKNLYPPFDERLQQRNPFISVSVNTDDLGIFDTSLENEYSLLVSALEKHNEFCSSKYRIPISNIYSWIDSIRENGCNQSFKN